MRRLLYVAHRVPYPPDKGERVRAFHEIKALSKDFQITLAALTHSHADIRAAEPLRQWCRNIILAPAGGTPGRIRAGLSLLKGQSATEGYFHSPALDKKIADSAGREPFDLAFAYCTSVLGTCLKVPARAHVIDFVDADSAKWQAYAQDSPWPKSWLYHAEARAVRKLEQLAIQRCQAVFITSQAEMEILDSQSPHIHAVGHGVDTDYFAPDANLPAPNTDEPSLVFTGQMDYRPNVDAVCWFVREVWPQLKRQAPNLTFQIVGRNPTSQVQRLTEIPGVVVTGAVPDVRPYLSAAAAAIVPLRIARGVQNKVLEAMAMARPVIASTGALSGLDVLPGREALRADSPQEWIEHILALTGPSGASPGMSQLAELARQCVLAKYNRDACLKPMVDICRELADSAAPAGQIAASQTASPGSASQHRSPNESEALL